MNDLDCYFFIDMDMEVQDEEDRVIRCLCIDCHDNHYPNAGWFYKGSEQGYGPFQYLCYNCKKVLHRSEEEEKELDF